MASNKFVSKTNVNENRDIPVSIPVNSGEGNYIGLALSSADECLASFNDNISYGSHYSSFEVRKSYWRILRARKFLSSIDYKVGNAQQLIAAVNQSFIPQPAAALVSKPLELLSMFENSSSLDVLVATDAGSEVSKLPEVFLPPSDIVTIVTNPIIEVIAIPNVGPATNIEIAAVICESELPALVPPVVNESMIVEKLQIPPVVNDSMTVVKLQMPPAVIESVVVEKLPEPVLVTISAEEIREIEKRKLSALALEEYSMKMGIITMEANTPQWLEISRRYWSALRDIKRDKEALVVEVPDSVPVKSPALSYSNSAQLALNSALLAAPVPADRNGSSNDYDMVDLTSDRMHMLGFAGIAKKLSLLHPAEVTLSLWGLESFDQWASQVVATNPSYTYEDNPLPGWSKNVCVRMGGKAQGSLEITYSPPERTKRLRSKIEILAYFTRYGLSSSLATRFDFRAVFCVCHTPEDSGSYLECSFGRAGCNRWLHSQCVGLGKRKEGELRNMRNVVCPFCTAYLESIGAYDYMKNKTCLRNITMTGRSTPVMINGFEIFESTKPHTVWGTVRAQPHPVSGRTASSSSSSSSSSQSAPRSHHAAPSHSSDTKGGHNNDNSKHLSSGLNDSSHIKDVTAHKDKVICIPSPTTHPLESSRTLPSTPTEYPTLLSGSDPIPPLSLLGTSPYPFQSPAVQSLIAPPSSGGSSKGVLSDVKSPPLGKMKPPLAKLLSTDPILARMFSHRLFQGASSATLEDTPTPDEASVTPIELPDYEMKSAVASSSSMSVAPMDYDDLAHTEVDYNSSVEPRDRVRWARLCRSEPDANPYSSGSLTASAPSSSSAFAPSSSSAPTYVRVKVSGGWMEPIGKYIRADYSGPRKPTDELALSTVEQRVREKQKVALGPTPHLPQQPLSNRCRRKLLEALSNSAHSAAHKKKIAGLDSRPSDYYNQPPDTPLLFYLPCEGGLTAGCVSCAPVPLQLHKLCSRGDRCAFCLLPFPPGSKAFSPAYVAAMQRRRLKLKKARAVKRRRLSGSSYSVEYDSEDDGSEPQYLVTKSVGSVTYVLHQQCASISDNGDLSEMLAMSLSIPSTAEQQDLPHTTDSFPHQNEWNSSKLFKGIDIGDSYECDEGDEAECDLCGRAGGIMHFFDLDPRYSSLPPPGEEGWLGHVPCISWLVTSKLLELPPSSLIKHENKSSTLYNYRNGTLHTPSQTSEGLTVSVVATDVEDNACPIDNTGLNTGIVEDKTEWILNTERTSNTKNKARAEAPKRSLFDSLAGQWRCSCCGTYAGVVLKCSAAACTVRAHPLCVSLLGEAWGAFKINSLPDNSPQVHAASDGNEQVPTAIGFLCALHRP